MQIKRQKQSVQSSTFDRFAPFFAQINGIERTCRVLFVKELFISKKSTTEERAIERGHEMLTKNRFVEHVRVFFAAYSHD